MSQHPQKKPMEYAPYPPAMQAPKSSLAPTPHYSASQFLRDAGGPAVKITTEAKNSDILLSPEKSYNSERMAPTHDSQIQIFPFSKDMLACINCVTPMEQRLHHQQQTESITKNRKGPIMLELRQVEFADTDNDFFTTKTIGYSRGNPSLGTSVASTCLDLPVVKTYSSNNNSRISAATGLSTGMLCIHSFGDTPDEEGLFSSSIEYFHTPRRQATASSVAWRSTNYNHVAIGLLGGSGLAQSQGTGQRRGGGGIRASGGDREFCCLIWDIEKQQSTAKQRSSTPLTKLSHNSQVASLAWMMDGQTLAVGGQSRTIQLYDMRVSGTNVPPISAQAHNFGVDGIEVDPYRQYLMATFCRSVGEPVKLWDIRRMESPLGEIKVGSANTTSTTTNSSLEIKEQGRVEVIKWGRIEPGILSVAMNDCIQDYDTKSGSRPVLVRESYVRKGSRIRDFALYPRIEKEVDAKIEDSKEEYEVNQSVQLLDKLHSRRMLTVLEDRNIYDMAKHNYSPIGISYRDGRVAHSLGTTLFMSSTTAGLTAMESSAMTYNEDISATMMRRARCVRAARYSMDTASNIKMLTEDIASGEPTNASLKDTFSLLRLWTWIDRVESLCNDEEMDDTFDWQAKGLMEAGVWQLLDFHTDISTTDKVTFSETLVCNVYDSPIRRMALTSCGWAGKFDLSNILAECEALGEYERSAALAVWHGDIGAAVQALQRASEIVRLDVKADENKSNQVLRNPRYAETLDLIAMCIAGFGSNVGAPSHVWQVACSTLLTREDLVATEANNTKVAYLRALCEFLLKVGSSEVSDQILGNKELSLSDRVAFACRFLEGKDLKAFLAKCIDVCQSTGDIEGLVVSGLSKDGIKILQSFVDRHADIQTAALVVSRSVLPPDWTYERRSCIEWVESYRSLLNTWQMWQSRAMFDVDRAEALRNMKVKTEGMAVGGGQKAVSFQSRRLPNPNRRQGPRSTDPDLAIIPAQLDARCNYCSAPLGLRQGATSQWLSKMKPVLSCCPNCRKPLPRCAICLLPLGCLNPYMELTRDRSRSGPRGNPTLASPDDLSSLANLPFAEWFTWCMRCKHGGHAHHLVGWFSNHETCPVSGCDCKCQFDGIQKLNRPALTQNSLVPSSPKD